MTCLRMNQRSKESNWFDVVYIDIRVLFWHVTKQDELWSLQAMDRKCII